MLEQKAPFVYTFDPGFAGIAKLRRRECEKASISNERRKRGATRETHSATSMRAISMMDHEACTSVIPALHGPLSRSKK
jgi:hypothetical protein